MNKKLKATVVTVAVIGSVCLLTMNKPVNTKQFNNVETQQQMEKRFNLTEEVIRDEVISKLKLNITDINFSKIITVGKNNTFMKGCFRNQKHIKYRILAHYSIDFSNINKEQIQIVDNKIVLILPAPSVETTILEDKTEFTNEKGLLAFGEPKLTPQQQLAIQHMLKEEITQEAYSNENMGIVKEDVNKQIEGLLGALTDKAYKVDIKWIN